MPIRTERNRPDREYFEGKLCICKNVTSSLIGCAHIKMTTRNGRCWIKTIQDSFLIKHLLLLWFDRFKDSANNVKAFLLTGKFNTVLIKTSQCLIKGIAILGVRFLTTKRITYIPPSKFHLIKGLWNHKWNIWKILFGFAFHPNDLIGFAHVTTAEMSWHVQNGDLIWWLFLFDSKIYIKMDYEPL